MRTPCYQLQGCYVTSSFQTKNLCASTMNWISSVIFWTTRTDKNTATVISTKHRHLETVLQIGQMEKKCLLHIPCRSVRWMGICNFDDLKHKITENVSTDDRPIFAKGLWYLSNKTILAQKMKSIQTEKQVYQT